MNLKNKLNKIAIEEGYDNISDFVEAFIIKGNSLADFQTHIGIEYGLFYGYFEIYYRIRKELKFPLQGTKGKIIRRNKLLEKQTIELISEGERFERNSTREKWIKKVNVLGFTSIRTAIHTLEKQFKKKEVAELLGMTRQNYFNRKTILKKQRISNCK